MIILITACLIAAILGLYIYFNIKSKDLSKKFSPGVRNTLSSIFDKILSDKPKEEDAADRCKRKADQVYGKKTSAYKSGAIVRCRKGKIWKKK